MPAHFGFYTKFLNDGSDDMRVDGSVTPVKFTLENITPGFGFLLNRIVYVLGGGTEAIDLDNFGDLGVPLTNGILFVANQETTGEQVSATIKTNADLFLISTQVQIDSVRVSASTQISQVHGSWNFRETYNNNAPLIYGNDLKFIIRDDLSAVNFLNVSCHGVLVEMNN